MSPLAAAYPSIGKALFLKCFGGLLGRNTSFRIDWRETLWDMCARFVAGLFLGAVLAFLLVPVIFWPSRRSRGRTLFTSLGEPGWIGYVFLAVWLGTAVIMALRTKARLHHLDPERTDPPML